MAPQAAGRDADIEVPGTQSHGTNGSSSRHHAEGGAERGPVGGWDGGEG
jgi:hypothetical protein